MASASDITIVRNNTNEPTTDPYSDEYVGALIDASGVTGATVVIWQQKVARFSTSVDVTEAGASHKMSDLFDNAVKMLDYWQGILDAETGPVVSGAVRVRVIDRVD